MDSRGRYGSEGDWVPFTMEHTGDAEDGYGLRGVASGTALVRRQRRHPRSLVQRLDAVAASQAAPPPHLVAIVRVHHPTGVD